jgi:anaerobic magnesium-protoporphyrin IX monomethyl ester cyclase
VRCTFCSTSSYWGQKVRTYSVTRVVDEMEMLISQFKVKKIFFHDDTFNLGIPRVKAICKEIMDRGIRIDWACSCRVVPASEDMIEAMVRAGCKHICWGIESGSEKMLEKINKKITRTQIRHAFELSNKFSNVMSTGAFAMVGNPGETAETIHETVKFMDTIAITDAPSTSVLYVLPGTLLYNTLKQTGQIRDEDWANFDSVPFYTIDNSYITMKHWANLVRNSGKRVTFKQEHFWSGTLATSDKKKVTLQNGRFKNLLRIVMHPAHIVSSAKSYLPSGKIHF